MSQPPGGHGLRYAPGLDGVRALAVLAVVVYHIGTTGAADLLPGGYLGVDVFFVLSGYLITSLLVVEAQHTGRISIKKFYIRRARRLLPALFALLLAVAAIGAFWLPQQAARLRGDLLASIGYVQNWWLIAQSSSYFGNTGDRPALLTHLWSLAVEEQYYLVWPLVLIAFAAVRARPAVMLTVVLAAVAASTAVGQLLYDPYADPSRVYYGTDTRALAPLLGAALAIAIRPWRHRTSLPRGTRAGLDLLGVASLAGLAVIAASLRDTDELLYRGGLVVIALLAAGLVAVAGHPGTLLGRVIATQPLRYLGERSYAIYLWHWPVCLLTRPGQDIPLTGWANTALRLAVAVALAEVSYQLVERPIRRHGFLATLRRPRTPEPTPPPTPAGLLPHPARGVAPVPTVRPAARPVPGPRRPLLPALRTAALAVLMVVGGAVAGVGLTNAASRPAAGIAIDLDPTTPAPSAPPTLAPGATVAFFGDSQAISLIHYAPSNLGQYIHAHDAAIVGCGVMLGRFESRSGERQDLTERCHNWRDVWRERVDTIDPDVAVIMIGAWELFDYTSTETGALLTFGSTEWDRAFRRGLAEGISIVRGPGRTVALALLPCYRPTTEYVERGDDERTRHVNALIRAAAASYGDDVYTVEPPAQFCTDPEIATSTAYRFDGVHYASEGAALYFRTLLLQLHGASPPG